MITKRLSFVISTVLSGLLFVSMITSGAAPLRLLAHAGGLFGGWLVSNKSGGGFSGLLLGSVPQALLFGLGFVIWAKGFATPEMMTMKFPFAVGTVVVMASIGALVGAFSGEVKE